MNVSEKGLEFIGRYEGLRLQPYNDAANNATIGYGHLIHYGRVDHEDLVKYQGFTTAEALDLLRQDAQHAVDSVNHLLKVRTAFLPTRRQARFDALVSFTFNCGGGALAVSSLLRGINEKGAPRGWGFVLPLFEQWDHAGGHELPGLKARRIAEAELFINGRYR